MEKYWEIIKDFFNDPIVLRSISITVISGIILLCFGGFFKWFRKKIITKSKEIKYLDKSKTIITQNIINNYYIYNYKDGWIDLPKRWGMHSIRYLFKLLAAFRAKKSRLLKIRDKKSRLSKRRKMDLFDSAIEFLEKNDFQKAINNFSILLKEEKDNSRLAAIEIQIGNAY